MNFKEEIKKVHKRHSALDAEFPSRGLFYLRGIPVFTGMTRSFFDLLPSIIMFLCLSILFSCSSPTTNQQDKITITDGIGREVQIPQNPQTVMALSPAMTELLFELNLGERIVGRTDQCDYPEACLNLPSVQVYPTVNIEKVLKINPDVVISNDEITPPETAEKLTQLGIPVLLYQVNTITELYVAIRNIAKLLNQDKTGDNLINQLKTKVVVSQFEGAQSSAVALVSMDPIYVHGSTSFLSEIMQKAGFENAVDSSLGNYPRVSREYLLKINPDYLLGYDKEGLDSTFFELYPELRQLKAYQQKHIYALDADLASRPTPRFVQLLDTLIKIRSEK